MFSPNATLNRPSACRAEPGWPDLARKTVTREASVMPLTAVIV
jgi:hypothetical protein